MENYQEQLVNNELEMNHSTDILGPGQQLKLIREQRNLSIEEVASRLFLRSSVIEAVERDDYSNMAAVVFAKGYLRSYAHLLQTDADEILEAFNAIFPEQEQFESKLWQSSVPPARRNNPVPLVMGLLVGVMIILFALWWGSGRHMQNQVSLKKPVTKLADNESLLPVTLPKGNQLTIKEKA